MLRAKKQKMAQKWQRTEKEREREIETLNIYTNRNGTRL